MSQMLTVRIDEALLDAVDAIAAERGVSRSVLARQGLEAAVGRDVLDVARESRLSERILTRMREDAQPLRETARPWGPW